MNNKGFISVTVIYSFFLVFLSLMVLIIASTATNRVLLNKMKDTIKEDIKDINKKNTNNDDYIDEDDIENVESNKTLADYCTSGEKLATCIKTFASNEDVSVTSIYHHDGTLENGISDGSYRYAGASTSVNNYVCFGSTASTCPDDNKYRIIGVFGSQVKLIKATPVGNRGWDSNQSNIWSTSSINTELNGDYLTRLTTTWSDKITTTTWKVAGNISTNIMYAVPKTVYINEIINPDKGDYGTEYTYSAKIGLMYVSDYLFAASENAWTLIGYSSSGSSYDYRSATSINWMYLGSDEWTITRYVDWPDYAFYVYSDGRVSVFYMNRSHAVRPVFYLNSSVTYASGTGTSTDPIRIN